MVKALGMAEGWIRESRSVVLQNFLWRYNTLVCLSQIRDPITLQSTGTTKDLPGEPMNLTRVTQRNIGEGLLRGAE